MELVKEIKTTNKKIHPPFGYFGSKNKIALQLSEDLPPHNCWVEAFCGSAAITLRKKQAPIEVINDIDNEIINVFEQLRDNHLELCRLIELTPYAEQELINARINGNGISKLEKARRFLVQSMMAINGVFGDERGGFSYSDSYSRNNHDARVNRWNNLPSRLKAVVERLKSVRIENKDARKLLKRYINRPATLVYLDPPYLGDRTNGYRIDANDEKFHKELLTLANKAKCMIFISGYENKLYDTILTAKRGWQKKTIKTTTKDSTGQSHNRTEVLWMNKYFNKSLEQSKIPLKLTDKEKQQGKVNPERKKSIKKKAK
ncbi:MAG: DNA adenine methylase [Bacteroidota bacterium]